VDRRRRRRRRRRRQGRGLRTRSPWHAIDAGQEKSERMLERRGERAEFLLVFLALVPLRATL
jgi:hypothetical protein